MKHTHVNEMVGSFAISIWEKLDESERSAIQLGIFPNEKMAEALKSGCDAHELAAELLVLAEQHPATPAWPGI